MCGVTTILCNIFVCVRPAVKIAFWTRILKSFFYRQSFSLFFPSAGNTSVVKITTATATITAIATVISTTKLSNDELPMDHRKREDDEQTN